MNSYEDEIRKLSSRVWNNLYMGNFPEPDRISIVMVRRELGKYYKVGQQFTFDGFRFTVLGIDSRQDAYIVSWREL